MEYKIYGELAQVAQLTFNKGETCWASRGSLVAYDPALEWSLKIPGGAGGAAKRMLAGEGVALTYIQSPADNLHATLSANQPGKIISWDLQLDGSVLTTRGSFTAAFGPKVDINIAMAKRAGAALFGGAGLFLQKLSGEGIVFIHGAGDFIEHHLEQGQSILVSTGNLAAFSADVDYDIKGVAGCRRMFFGGEGIFMTLLKGPGRVLLQSLKRTPITQAAAGG